ncbi:hypothetical protein E2C01_037129 [Portunus trituberculatus]|uniref:Secreted protein n=1 Tax=Portunus trituberculatus TaxID=210409 RepID=A0A5B7F7B1_PORTR|nr:hypothetical protein [Portunus trituberculatus]
MKHKQVIVLVFLTPRLVLRDMLETMVHLCARLQLVTFNYISGSLPSPTALQWGSTTCPVVPAHHHCFYLKHTDQVMTYRDLLQDMVEPVACLQQKASPQQLDPFSSLPHHLPHQWPHIQTATIWISLRLDKISKTSRRYID